MKIGINGKEYDVPQQYEHKLLLDLWGLGLAEYAKLAPEWRILIKPFTRGILQLMENHVAKSQGKEAGKAVRPPHGADPTLHLASLLIGMLREGLKHVTLDCQTEYDTITSFNLSIAEPRQGEAGRQMGIDRDFGLRENNRT